MKKTSIVIFILLTNVFFAFTQTKISLEIKNNPFKVAYLAAIKGPKQEDLGAQNFKGNSVSFIINGKLIAGMYRIIFPDSMFVDVIAGNDNEIALHTQVPALIDSLVVDKGNDNKMYYDFIHYKNASLAKLNIISNNFKAKYSGKKNNPLADERLSFIKGCITYDINHYAETLISKDKDAFVSKIIKALLVPNVNLYTIENPDTILFDNDIEFLLQHFFDNIDFADSSFLNTEFYYHTVKFYIEKIVQPRNVMGFNFANEFILKKASSNKKVFNYVLTLLFDLYEVSQLEEVYVKLYDDYLSKETGIFDKARYNDIAAKVNLIKRLVPGKIAPDFYAVDTMGAMKKLSEVNKDRILVVFYSASDKRSDETFSKLEDVYSVNKNKGFEIVAVCIDSTNGAWKSFLRKHKNATWINLEKNNIYAENNISEMYNTWSLPGLYLMDKERKIILKPMNIDYLQKFYPELFKVK